MPILTDSVAETAGASDSFAGALLAAVSQTELATPLGAIYGVGLYGTHKYVSGTIGGREAESVSLIAVASALEAGVAETLQTVIAVLLAAVADSASGADGPSAVSISNVYLVELGAGNSSITSSKISTVASTETSAGDAVENAFARWVVASSGDGAGTDSTDATKVSVATIEATVVAIEETSAGIIIEFSIAATVHLYADEQTDSSVGMLLPTQSLFLFADMELESLVWDRLAPTGGAWGSDEVAWSSWSPDTAATNTWS